MHAKITDYKGILFKVISWVTFVILMSSSFSRQAFVLTTTDGAVCMPGKTFAKCITHLVIVARLTYHSALHSHMHVLSTLLTEKLIRSRSYTFATWAQYIFWNLNVCYRFHDLKPSLTLPVFLAFKTERHYSDYYSVVIKTSNKQ